MSITQRDLIEAAGRIERASLRKAELAHEAAEVIGLVIQGDPEAPARAHEWLDDFAQAQREHRAAGEALVALDRKIRADLGLAR